MLRRILGLTRRTVDVYNEAGLSAARSYIYKSFATKGATVASHLWATRQYMLPWRLAAEVRRLRTIRREGRLTLAIAATGGLGDLIIAARCIRDLQREAEPFSFDVFVSAPDTARWLFSAVPGFERAFADTIENIAGRAYDLRLCANQTIVISPGSEPSASLRQAPRMTAVVNHINRARRSIEPYIRYHPLLDNGLARKAVMSNRCRRDFLHSMAGLEYGGDQLDIASDDSIISRLGLTGRPFVTLHNGFDPNFVIVGQRATKCYPHFAEVVAGLKAARPDLLIVQIGTATSEPIAHVDVPLIGRTNLQEVAGLLRATSLHLDNEGGLVHLAACYGRRSVVVFGPTPSDYFGYPHNINVDPLRCGNCWWIDELWMDRCPRGLAEPECVYAQPPETIVSHALQALGARDAALLPLQCTRSPNCPTDSASSQRRAL